MQYSDYKIEQLLEVPKYRTICECFLSLVESEEDKEILTSILVNGGYNNYSCTSNMCNKDNPRIESQRRISMAYLFIKNRETFDYFVENNINLFHGTNANALPSIIEHGLNCVDDLKEKGIEVTTGEEWSRIGGKRNFSSLTDVLDISQGYASFNPKGADKTITYGIVLGISKNEEINSKSRNIYSDIPELGIVGGVSKESIKSISVPSDKVEFVKKIVGEENIKVLPMDDMEQKFFYFNDSYIEFSQEEFEKFKRSLKEEQENKTFKEQELDEMVKSRKLFDMKKMYEKIRQLLTKKEDLENGRNVTLK